MNGIVKAKCSFIFQAMKNGKDIKCQIELTDHYLSISLESISVSCRELIQNIFAPLYITHNGSLNINYSLIKTVQVVQNAEAIIIDVFNPVMKVDFSFTLNQFETSSRIMFKKKMSINSIHLLGIAIQQLINKETKYLIQKIIQLIAMLKDCIDPQKGDNHQIESILCQSYMHGKAYYEKYTTIYKSNLKLKKGIKKQLNEKLKMLDSMISEQEQIKRNLACSCFESLINELKIRTSGFLEESIMFFFKIVSLENQILDFKNVDKIVVADNLRTLKDEDCTNQASSNQLNKSSLQRKTNLLSKGNKSNALYTNTHSNNNNNSNNLKVNKSCNNISDNTTLEAFDRLNNSSSNYTNAIKQKGLAILNSSSANYYTNNANLDNQTISISTKNTSKKKEQTPKKAYCFAINSKDILETPKFNTNNNIQYKYLKAPYEKKEPDYKLSKQKEVSLSMLEIMKQIEYLIKKHSFVPPVDVYNIFANTSEIIHRKFFEICFDMFVGKLFSYEIDNDNLIKIDSMYNYFLYLRGVKNFLFMDKNKMYYSSMIFNADG